jgi:hypothetical protein
MKYFAYFAIIFLIETVLVSGLEVLYAVNNGGDQVIGSNGIQYTKDNNTHGTKWKLYPLMINPPNNFGGVYRKDATI